MYGIYLQTMPTTPFQIPVVLFKAPHFMFANLKVTLRLWCEIRDCNNSPSNVPDRNEGGGSNAPELDKRKKGSTWLYPTVNMDL